MKGILMLSGSADTVVHASELPWSLLLLSAMLAIGLAVREKGGFPAYEYDERQKAARGIAFRWAWITAVVYETVYAVLNAVGIRYADEAAGPLLGVLLSIAVFLFTASAKDAMWPFRDRWNSAGGWTVWTLLGVVWVVLSALRLHRKGIPVPWIVSSGMLELLTGFLLAVFGAVQLIRLLRRRGGNEKDGEDE